MSDSPAPRAADCDAEPAASSEAELRAPSDVEGLGLSDARRFPPNEVEGFDWPPPQEDLDLLDAPVPELAGLRRTARIHWITQGPNARGVRVATDSMTSHDSRFDASWAHAPLASSRSLNWTAAIYAMCGLVLVLGSFLVLGLMSALSLAVPRPPSVTRSLAVPVNPPYLPVTLDQAKPTSYASQFLERFSIASNAEMAAASSEPATSRSHAPAGVRLQDQNRITPFVAGTESLSDAVLGYRSSTVDSTAVAERLNHNADTEPIVPSSADSHSSAFTPPRRLSEFYVRPQVAVAGDHTVTGEVELMAHVLDSGEVGAVETVASTLPGLGLEEAASAAVKQWRYTPALADGQPVETRVRVLVTFR